MEKFSSLAKRHLCEKTYEELGIGERDRMKWKDCCSRSFLRSVFLFLGKEEGENVLLYSDRRELLEITAYLLIRVLDLEAQAVPYRGKNRNGLCLSVDRSVRETVLKETAPLSAGCQRCLVLFLRGAFLSCGTVMDPVKGYHAAFTASGPEAISELEDALSFFGIQASRGKTGEKDTVYLKDSGKIEDLLSVVGAEKYALELMNQKIERSIRANINRRQNFDGANLQKAVNGAQAVIRAIHFLDQRGILETLPEALRNAAKLRMSYPEISLAELCERSEEELTKSGLNHRLQKLVRLAEQRKKEEESV